MFKVLNGPTYSENDRPPFWKNNQPLMGISNMTLGLAPLDQFPLIEDFEVRLEAYEDSPDFGYHLRFFSPSRGYVASFPWWDFVERKLIRDDFKIYMGDLQKPVSDVEQGWEIVIAAHGDYVYVLEGDFDAPADGYYSWFKVEKDRYVAEWQKAIDACREAFLTNDQ